MRRQLYTETELQDILLQKFPTAVPIGFGPLPNCRKSSRIPGLLGASNLTPAFYMNCGGWAADHYYAYLPGTEAEELYAEYATPVNHDF